MQKILVFCETERAGDAIKRTIEKTTSYQVTFVNDLQGAKIQIESKLFNVILVDCQVVNENIMARIEWLLHVAKNTPMIVFTANIENHVLRKIEMREDVHVLMRPTAEKNLLALVKKLMVAKTVPKQRHRRYNTNQTVVFENIARGERVSSQMYNLSKGGAYCEFAEGQKLNMGERYRLQIVIGETNRTYNFEAVVVWSTGRGKFSGRPGCGIKFLT